MGIFESAFRYFALERCFPLAAGTVFILLSVEFPWYPDTLLAQLLPGITRSLLSKSLQRALLRRDPFRHHTTASIGFLLSHHANIERIPPIRTECGRGWLQPAELSISSQTHGITAHVNVPETGPAFGAIGEWIIRPDGPGDRTRDQPI